MQYWGGWPVLLHHLVVNPIHNGSSGTYLPVKENTDNGFCHF